MCLCTQPPVLDTLLMTPAREALNLAAAPSPIAVSAYCKAIKWGTFETGTRSSLSNVRGDKCEGDEWCLVEPRMAAARAILPAQRPAPSPNTSSILRASSASDNRAAHTPAPRPFDRRGNVGWPRPVADIGPCHHVGTSPPRVALFPHLLERLFLGRCIGFSRGRDVQRAPRHRDARDWLLFRPRQGLPAHYSRRTTPQRRTSIRLSVSEASVAESRDEIRAVSAVARAPPSKAGIFPIANVRGRLASRLIFEIARSRSADLPSARLAALPLDYRAIRREHSAVSPDPCASPRCLRARSASSLRTARVQPTQ